MRKTAESQLLYELKALVESSSHIKGEAFGDGPVLDVQSESALSTRCVCVLAAYSVFQN